jgi:8-oxo-dGTP pyrophosphatase MutT (NUDIX family)
MSDDDLRACSHDPSRTIPSRCAEKPELLLGAPIGMYHCPDCGEMVLAGVPHPDVCLDCYAEMTGRPYTEAEMSETTAKPKTKTMRMATAILVRSGDQILVVNNRKWGRFSLPGGKAHEGETMEAAARRELFEETGLRPESMTFIGANVCSCDPTRLDEKDHIEPWMVFGYLADCGTQTPAYEPEPGTFPRWTTVADLLANGLFPAWDAWFFGLPQLGPATYKVGIVGVIRRFDAAYGGDKILLGRRLKKDKAEGKWVLPGGGLEPEESLADALIRECREEVGLVVEPGRLITATRSAHTPGKPSNVALIYWARAKGAQAPVGTAEIGEPAFFSIQEAEKLDVMPVTRDVFDIIRSELWVERR